MKENEMPVLRPIPIKTKDVNFFVRVFRWVFSIRKWQLEEDWYYNLFGEKGERIMIPKGFTFDGASIPRPFWAILSPVGLLLIPGLIHDYGYKYNELIRIDDKGNKIPYMKGASRIEWDNLFKKVAVDVNGFALINRIAWLSVVLFGWISWCKHRERDNKSTLVGKPYIAKKAA